MPSQIMRPQSDTNKLTGFFYNHPRGGVAYRENSLIKLNLFLTDIVFESVSYFFGMKTTSISFPLLGSRIKIFLSSTSAGLSFRTSPTRMPPRPISSSMRRFSDILCSEDDFIYNILF